MSNLFTTIYTSRIKVFKKAVFCLLLLLAFNTNELAAQCSISCQNDIEITLFGRDELRIRPVMVLVNPDATCPNGDFLIEVFAADGTALGDVVNYQYINQDLTFRVTDTNSNNTCDGRIFLVDKLAPEILCEELMVGCNIDTSPESLGYPTISDNITLEDDIEVTYEDRVINLNCLAEANGQGVTMRIERDWFAVDESGNEETCTQTIFLKRPNLIDITFPAPIDDVNIPALNCSDDDPLDFSLTGEPLLHGQRLLTDGACDLSVTYRDRITDYCTGSYQILRYWYVVDKCTDEERTKVQIIEVKDRTAPALVCPDTIRAFVNPANCKANVTLEEPEVSDNCSIVTTLIQWEYGTGRGPFTNVPYGEHDVFYTAKDACGNESRCSSVVIVSDEIKPVILCAEDSEVLLTPEGVVIADAEIFDNGSHDNCAIENYLVRRAGGEWSDQITFDCSDVANSPLTLIFRVTDINGLFSECELDVRIVDRDVPEVLCPADKTITCTEDYNDLNLTGKASGMDICGIATIAHSDVNNLNHCGLGTIRRTWQVTDINGNTSTCEQLITVAEEGTVEINFPEAIVVEGCTNGILPETTGEPTISGVVCTSNYGIDYTDNSFGDSPPACYEIYRKWTVIDFCTYIPNDPSGKGYWEFTQTIEVVDNTAPEITCPADEEIDVFNGNCETFVRLDLPTVTDCSPDVTITNDSPYATDNGADASGMYPVGAHVITFSATDGCGNISTCSFMIKINDKTPPVPVCLNGVTIPLDEHGHVFVTPNMISVSATDNCFAPEQVSLTVTPNEFDCSHIGNQEIVLEAVDPMGNSAICIVDVMIQDNLNHCPDPVTGRVTVGGTVRTNYGDMIHEVPMLLNNDSEGMVMSDEEGKYSFSNLSLNNSYTVRPRSVNDFDNGVTTYDLILVRRHILGVALIEDPYQLIAADVNQSGNISTFDMLVLRRVILGIDRDMGDTPSWKFIDAKYEFQEGYNPMQANYPTSISYEALTNNEMHTDFIGIKMGDVNGNAKVNFNNQEIDERNTDGELIFTTDNQKIDAGYAYEVPIKAKDFNNIEGFQLTFDYDTKRLNYLGLEINDLPNLKEENFNLLRSQEGQITLSWEYFSKTKLPDDATLFTLHFNALTTSQLQDELKLTSSRTRAEAYSYDNERLSLALQFEETNTKPQYFLYQNSPNPFFDITTVGFFLPKATEVLLTIYDMNGKEVKNYIGNYAAGQQTIEVDLTTMPSKGLLYYTLSTPITKTISGKMLRVNEGR